MYKGMGQNRGLRCQICTGCGVCPGVASGDGTAGQPHVLAENALSGEKLPFETKGVRLAVADVGTTTIAMLLYGSDGSVADRYVSVNPQIKYGADVLSRIKAAEQPLQARELQELVCGVLEHGLRRFLGQLETGESLKLALAANTTMTYLLMGWDPEELGHAPFAASHLSGVETELGGVPCFIFPAVSAFVGGDITAGIHACKMAERQELTLLIDLGTNGELVLGNREKRIACATAAGPAFEGGVNRGIWGADMVSLLARLRREGVLDETGLLAPEFFDTGIRIGNVPVNQQAVRSVQLAKAAIAAGIEVLMDRYGVNERQVDRVVLAGGFGYYLKREAAAEIGLLPAALAEKTITGGNTALTGALLAGRELLTGDPHSLTAGLERIAEGTEVVNLALEPSFEKRYIQAMELKKLKK